VHDDRVVLERHWRGHRPGDWTNSASMAKTITALLIGIALDEGKIRSLDDPASQWLTAWQADARRKITLRHLLQMHAGLKPMGAYEEPFSDASYLALGTDLRYIVDNVAVVEEPGRRFDYNNLNFQALGFVLEAATGRRYAELLSEKLWKPLGAGDSAVWLDRDGGSARTFGYLFATTTDWAKVGLLLLHDGIWDGRQIVSREFLRALITPSPTEPFYGLGIWLERADRMCIDAEGPFLGDGIFYLDGHSKQRVYVVPAQRLVVVRVGENARGWDESALVNAVLRGLGRRGAKP
jgi:CubicO group peptidase (beta-lactamase class C family)